MRRHWPLCPTPRRRRLATGAAALLLGACRVTVPETDQTRPELRVTLSDAGDLGAQYSKSEPLYPGEPIDPARTLFIGPADVDTPISLQFEGVDRDSGVAHGRAFVVVSFTCFTNEGGTNEPSLSHGDKTKEFFADFGRPALPAQPPAPRPPPPSPSRCGTCGERRIAR